eukprot:7981507-Karenia_brevis.AAC.1
MSVLGNPRESLSIHVSHWQSTLVIVIPRQSLAIHVSHCQCTWGIGIRNMSVVPGKSYPGNSPGAHIHSPGMPRSSAQVPRHAFPWIVST